MPTLYDHISSNSKTAFRKVLRTTLEGQFAQATSFVDGLCKDMCAERIYPHQCLGQYGEILKMLHDIEVTFANYAESRRRAVGVDTKGDIAFMQNHFNDYKLKITQLKKGIEERLLHVRYFEPERPEKNKSSMY